MTVWFLVGNGEMDYETIIGDYIRATIGIHSPFPTQHQTDEYDP